MRRLRDVMVALGLVTLASGTAALPAPPPGFPVGEKLPALVLKDAAGRAVTLSANGQPTLLVFYRGVWCPSCQRRLAALRALAGKLRIVAISPDAPDTLARVPSRFELLSDEGEQAVTALCAGLAHCEALVDAGGVVRWAGASESWSRAADPDALLAAARSL